MLRPVSSTSTYATKPFLPPVMLWPLRSRRRAASPSFDGDRLRAPDARGRAAAGRDRRAHGLVRRHPDAVEVARILGRVERRGDADGRLRRRRQRRLAELRTAGPASPGRRRRSARRDPSAGAGAASDAGMFTMPAAARVVEARAGRCRARLRAARRRAATPSSVGRSVQTHAAAALTIGAEKLVPSSPVW